MIENLEQYFAEEHQFYLNKIKFERVEGEQVAGEVSLNCKDNIAVTVNNERGVTLIVTRRLEFDPRSLFDLEVSFGAELTFIQEKRDEINWSDIDLADEFKKNGGFVLANIMNRISLLIGQITSSFGSSPLITLPGIPCE